jgi:cytochrome c-type biogenesis protein CcmH
MRTTVTKLMVWAGLLGLALPAIQTTAQDKEEIARRIQGELMAPCCWAEPVSQHQSPVAEEMRRDIRAMVAAGKSEQEILDFYVAQYGERILTTPPNRGFNRLVYILPWASALAGAAALALVLRKWLARTPAGSEAFPVEERYAHQIDRELRDLE